MKSLLLFCFLSLAIFKISAQETTFKAEVSRKSLGENERLRIDFSMNKEGDNFTPPSFDGFEVSGPTQSISNSWVNGVRSFSKTYTYILSPKRKGKINIGVATIEIDGKEYKTKPLSVEVTDAVANPKNNISSTPRSQGFGGFPFNFDPFAEEDEYNMEVIEPEANQLFLTAEVAKTNVYINEPIAITYKIYLAQNYGIAGFQDINFPKYTNFWNQLLSDKFVVNECTYEGKSYRCITLRQVLVFPQQVGEQVLDPLSITLDLQMPTNRVDFFGQRSYVTRSKTLRSPTQKIKVKALPEEGKPEDFSGAVGQFSMEVQLSKKEVEANETLQAEVSIIGNGNFNLFDFPKLQFPPTLEVYDPEKKEQLNASVSGIKGDITQTYTIVPQYKGKFPIQPINFTYFNPNTEKYVTLTSESHTIEVIKGNEYKPTTEDKQEIVQNDFHPLKKTANLQPIAKKIFFGSTNFYLLWLLPLLIIPICIIIWNIYNKYNEDTQENRQRRTNKLAKKYLSTAKRNLNDKDSFYESLEKGLHTYLKAKLHIETTELSKERIEELLSHRGVETETIQNFLQLLSNCEKARYSPYTQADMDNDYAKAVEIIAILDKQIRKK
ncbi:MAG: BatD family protein [Capnocytophaga sp.]|nr:BatD family protein [Capnocytophaga sp.]